MPAIFIKGESRSAEIRGTVCKHFCTHAASFIEQGGSAVLSIDGGDVLEAFELGK